MTAKGMIFAITWRFVLAICALAVALAMASQAHGQDITPDDARKIRELMAENKALRAENAELKSQVEVRTEIAEEWKALYIERNKLLIIRDNQIEEMRKEASEVRRSKKDLKLANEEYKVQANLDKQRMEAQDKKIRKLKKRNVIYGVVGFVTGTAVGLQFRF